MSDRKPARADRPSEFLTVKLPRFGASWNGLAIGGCATPIATGQVTAAPSVWALVTLGVSLVLRDIALGVLTWLTGRSSGAR